MSGETPERIGTQNETSCKKQGVKLSLLTRFGGDVFG
jgi:hypothetical protein